MTAPSVSTTGGGRDAQAAQVREHGAGVIADALLPKLLAGGAAAGESAAAGQIREMILATPVAGLTGALGAMRDRPDSTAMLEGLTGLPALVLVGEDDPITPVDDARRMAEAISGARLEVISNAGHVPPIEQPEATTRTLMEFLRSL